MAEAAVNERLKVGTGIVLLIMSLVLGIGGLFHLTRSTRADFCGTIRTDGVLVSCQQNIDEFTVIIPEGFKSFPELQTLSKIVYPLQVISNNSVGKCYWNPCSLWPIYIDSHGILNTCGGNNFNFKSQVATVQDLVAEESFAECEKTVWTHWLLSTMMMIVSVILWCVVCRWE